MIYRGLPDCKFIPAVQHTDTRLVLQVNAFSTQIPEQSSKVHVHGTQMPDWSSETHEFSTGLSPGSSTNMVPALVVMLLHIPKPSSIAGRDLHSCMQQADAESVSEH